MYNSEKLQRPNGPSKTRNNSVDDGQKERLIRSSSFKKN